MTKDYYKILEIPEFSTQDEIKCAYRKLARKYHPDIAGNSSDAISRFKEINEAYEVLSNIIKKEEYDRTRKFYSYASDKETKKSKGNSTHPNSKKEPATEKKQQNKSKNSFSIDWEELFLKKHHNAEFKKYEKEQIHPQKGSDINTDVEITIEEALSGVTKIINILHTSVCPKCSGRKFVNGSICTHCNGKGETSQHKKFSVKIPAGIKNNSKIRLSGEGENGLNGRKNGDLYLTVHIKNNNEYKTEGLNIIKTVQINPYEAVLGTEIEVKTPNGNVNVKISANTQNNQKIRLSGCGINQGSRVGDMIISVEINIPLNISEEEILLYKQIKNLREQADKKH